MEEENLESMTKILPIKVIVLILWSIFPIAVQSQDVLSLKPDRGFNVGDIRFDPELDDKSFVLCNRSFIYQYSTVGGGYKGGRKKILSYLENSEAGRNTTVPSSGFITVRFVVNCKGLTDRFRVLQIDKEYRPTKFDPVFVDDILAFTKNLSEWRLALYNGKPSDYYQYLTFKIEDGKIVDLLP